MTLEEFQEKFRELMRQASDSGLKPEDLCAIAEHVLENGWQLLVE